MFALAVETNSDYQLNTYELAPTVLLVPELDSDKMVRARAAKFIGACIANQQVEQRPYESILEVQPIESLYDAIQLAAEGDPVACQMVEANVRTDVIERTIKAGHVMKVNLHVDEAGKIQQHGQTMESVQANSLRLTAEIMRQRTEAEALNAFRIEQLFREGVLSEYTFVVFSRAADNMTTKQMNEVGFFTDTMTCVIQGTTVRGGQLTTESAFVAGVERPGEDRHDAETLESVMADLNLNFTNKTADEGIGMPVLIPNRLIPNGMIDLVKLWDKPNGTFFGEAKPRQDYLEYLTKCREREALLQPKINTIVEELIAEASVIKNRLHATQRLHKLSEKHMVEQAVFDHDINPLVFGAEAAEHIELARIQFEAGKHQSGLEELRLAKKTADSSSCPTMLKTDNELGDPLVDKNEESKTDNDCEFVSKECPVCHKKNVKTKVTKTKIQGSCGCKVKR